VVARAFGRDWWAQYREPLHRTLIAFDRLDEVERIERLVAEGHDLDRAYLHNKAVNAPPELEKSYREWQGKLRRDPHGRQPVGFTDAERRAILRRLALTTAPREVC
jgi:hypothetical protein